MKITIHVGKPEDATDVANLLGQLGYPVSASEAASRIKLYSPPPYLLLIAKTEEETVGFIALHVYDELHLPGPVGRITSFCVNETVRGTGVGTRLLHAAEYFFKEKGCFKIEVTSNLRRMHTHHYYLHHGYKETSKHFVKIIER
jgi:GNAT superfamily N-acetyltransferase